MTLSIYAGKSILVVNLLEVHSLSPAAQRLLTRMTTALDVRRVYKTFRLSLWKISGTWPLLFSQDGDNGTIRILASDGSDDGFIVRGEAICTIVLTVADNRQVIAHIIVQSHRPDITGIRGIATHGDICALNSDTILLNQVHSQLIIPLHSFFMGSDPGVRSRKNAPVDTKSLNFSMFISIL